MRTIRDRPLQVAQQTATGPALYGSTTAGSMLRDLLNSTDSLDIVTIGDSNMGYSDAGVPSSYGHTAGIHRYLSSFGGVNAYATPLFPGAVASNGAWTSAMFGAGLTYTTPSDGQAGNTGTVRRLIVAAAVPDADAASVVNNLNINAAILPKFAGLNWDSAFVTAGVTYTSPANQNYIGLGTTNLINIGTGSGSTNCQYRVVYAKFTTSGGQFKPVVWSSSGSTVASSFVSTAGGSAGNWYGTTTLDFASRSPVVENRCGWDGLAQSASTTGPFACLWHSVARRSFKGYAVNPLIYDGGKKTGDLADRVEGMGNLLDSYLKELRARQIASGGSGRLLVYVNSGINQPETAAQWTAAADRIVNRITERWVSGGGSRSNLAFVFTITHPCTVDPWLSSRPALATNANQYAQTRTSSNISVVDIAVAYPAYKLLNGSQPAGRLYSSIGGTEAEQQAHLTFATNTQANGYDAVAGSVMMSLMSKT